MKMIELNISYINCFILQGGLSQNIHDPLIRVDPDHRCACLLIYGRHLVVIPFKHATKMDQEQASEG